MKQWDKIYDVHCHLMNLSHPDFLAFINRIYGDIAPERVRMPLVFQTLAVISFFNELNRGGFWAGFFVKPEWMDSRKGWAIFFLSWKTISSICLIW